MLISLVSLLGGILNSLGRFWVNAAAPVLLNICLIVGLLFFRGSRDRDRAHAGDRGHRLGRSPARLADLGVPRAGVMLGCKRRGSRRR